MFQTKIFKTLISSIFFVLVSVHAFSYEGSHYDHAYHINNYDHLWEADDAVDDGVNTIYSPDYDDLPDDVVVDEIYLRINFKSTASIDNLLNITCGGGVTLTKNDVRYKEGGDDLIISYSFADPDRQDEESLYDSCLRIKVKGVNTVDDIEVVFTFHKQFKEAMPSLYADNPYGFSYGEGESTTYFDGGANTLHRIENVEDLEGETSCEKVSKGTKIPGSTKKLIILIHGWNPGDSKNNFAPEPCTLPHDESTSNLPLDGRTEFKWKHLYRNLSNHPATKIDDWVISRYDWSQDAQTGAVVDIQGGWLGTAGTANANASRDAAHAHGRKLGRIISSLDNPTHIQLIAHSAGNWLARRAADYLEQRYGSSISIQVTSLDPFVNDGEVVAIDDMNMVPNFELMASWANKPILDNYYANDIATDFNGWTSGDFTGWDKNQQIELLDDYLYEYFMNNHGGPVYWYARTADKDNYLFHLLTTPRLGFGKSIAYRWDSSKPYIKSENFSRSPNTNIYVFFSNYMDPETFISSSGRCLNSISIEGSQEYVADCSYDISAQMLKIDPLVDFDWSEVVSVKLTSDVKDLFRNSLYTSGQSNQFSINVDAEPAGDPTGIILTASANKATATEGEMIAVTGTVYYNNGTPVTEGTLLICPIDGVELVCLDDETMSIKNGYFSSNEVRVPKSGKINLTVSIPNGNSSFEDEQLLTLSIIDEDTIQSSDFKLQTYIVDSDDIYVEEGGLFWGGEVKAFRTDDRDVTVFTVLTGENTKPISMRYRFYYPNGEKFNSELEYIDYLDSGDWKWFYRTPGYLIDGNSMASRPGEYRVKVYADDQSGENWEKLATHYYVVGWDLKEHRIAKGINDSSLDYVDPTNVFVTTDDRVYVWSKFENVAQSINIKWEFYQPNGDLYDSFLRTTEDPGQDEWFGWQKAWGWLDVAGSDAETLTGSWQVKVLIQNPVTESYEVSYTDYFKVTEKNPVDPEASIYLSPYEHTGGDQLYLAPRVSDNTQIQEYTVHYNIGDGWTEHTYQDIYKSFETSYLSLGIAEEGQVISYWLEAIDTSGNSTSTPVATQVVPYDDDDDGIINEKDNCPNTANHDQLNTDGLNDGGNACDQDDDNDGMSDSWEALHGTDILVKDANADINDNGISNYDEYLADLEDGKQGWRYPRADISASGSDEMAYKQSHLVYQEIWNSQLSDTDAYLASGIMGASKGIELAVAVEAKPRIYSENGEYYYSAPTSTDLGVSGLILDDLDGDGINEMLVGADGHAQIDVYSNGAREFSLSPELKAQKMWPLAYLRSGKLLVGYQSTNIDRLHGVAMWNLNTREEMWYYELGTTVISASVADINHDGVSEFILSTETNHISGMTGLGIEETGSLTTGDALYTIIIDEYGNTVLLNEITPRHLRSYSNWGPPIEGEDDWNEGYNENVFSDLDDDGEYEIVSAICLNYYCDLKVLNLDGTDRYSEDFSYRGSPHFIVSDLNGDGLKEIIATKTDGGISSTNALIYDNELSVKVGSNSVFQGQNPSALGLSSASDVDGDGVKEIVSYTESNLYIHSGIDFSLMLYFPFDSQITNIITTDLSGDGTVEIAVTTSDGVLHLLDAVDNEPPVLEIPSEIEIEITSSLDTPQTHPDIAAFIEGASASDNVDGENLEVSNDGPDAYPLGITIVTFKVKDAAGHEVTESASITIISIDYDADTILNEVDNCPYSSNTEQLNTDGSNDGGDACDLDDDNDGMSDSWEVAHGTDPLTKDDEGDINTNGILNYQEYLTDIESSKKGWRYPYLNELANASDNEEYKKSSLLYEEIWSQYISINELYMASGNVDGEPGLDLIVAGGNRPLIFNADGEYYESVEVPRMIQSVNNLVLEDLDSDGINELLLGHKGESKLEVYKGTETFYEFGPNETGDLDNPKMWPLAHLGSGRMLVAYGSQDINQRHGVALWDANNKQELWYYELGTTVIGASVADIDNDGVFEFTLSTEANHIEGMVGFGINGTGPETKGDNLYNIILDENGNNLLNQAVDEEPLQEHPDGIMLSYNQSAFADLEGDGKYEIFVATCFNFDCYLQILNLDGSVRKSLPFSDSYGHPNFLLSDLDADGAKEIVAIDGGSEGYNRGLYVFDSTLAQYLGGRSGLSPSGPDSNRYTKPIYISADIDGDGKNEIVADDENMLVAYKFNEGEFVKFDIVEFDWKIEQVLTTDLTGDGTAEIALLTADGVLHLLDAIDAIIPELLTPSNIEVEATSELGVPSDNPEIIRFLNGVSASDDIDGVLTDIQHDGPSYYSLGVTDVTFIVKDNAGNESQGVAQVTVVDTTSPVIDGPSNLSIELTQGSSISIVEFDVQNLIYGVTANDNVDGNISVENDAPLSFELGSTTITFTAIDSAGNTSEQSVEVSLSSLDNDSDGLPNDFEIVSGLNVNDPSDAIADLDGDGRANIDEYQQGTNISVDDVPPELSIPEDIIANSTGPETPIELGVATAIDIKDGLIIPSPDNIGPFVPGVHLVTWSATDVENNSATAQQTVNIIPMATLTVSQVTPEGADTLINVSLRFLVMEVDLVLVVFLLVVLRVAMLQFDFID